MVEAKHLFPSQSGMHGIANSILTGAVWALMPANKLLPLWQSSFPLPFLQGSLLAMAFPEIV